MAAPTGKALAMLFFKECKDEENKWECTACNVVRTVHAKNCGYSNLTAHIHSQHQDEILVRQAALTNKTNLFLKH